MKNIEVKELAEIDGIINYLDEPMTFSCYEKCAEIICYSFDNHESMYLDVMTEDDIIFNNTTIRKLISLKTKVDYLCFTHGAIDKRWYFRPLCSTPISDL